MSEDTERPQQGKLSQQERDRIGARLLEHGARLPCPRCGGTHFVIAEGYFSHPLQFKVGQLVLGGQTIPCAIVVCTKCGFISQHALGILDLMPGEEPARERK